MSGERLKSMMIVGLFICGSVSALFLAWSFVFYAVSPSTYLSMYERIAIDSHYTTFASGNPDHPEAMRPVNYQHASYGAFVVSLFFGCLGIRLRRMHEANLTKGFLVVERLTLISLGFTFVVSAPFAIWSALKYYGLL